MMKPISVLLVDDHQIIVDGIRSLLRDQEMIKVIGDAGNGKEAIDFLKLLRADVVLLDVDMPLMNGIETTRQIKKAFEDVRVIILTMHNEGGLIKTLMAAGADGYMLKNSNQEELVEAIRKVAAGQTYFSSEATLSLLNQTTTSMTAYSTEGMHPDLTAREIEILKLVAQGLTNREIGEQLFISHRTVDTHRTNLMKKLGVSNVAGLIRYAIKQGFVS